MPPPQSCPFFSVLGRRTIREYARSRARVSSPTENFPPFRRSSAEENGRGNAEENIFSLQTTRKFFSGSRVYSPESSSLFFRVRNHPQIFSFFRFCARNEVTHNTLFPPRRHSIMTAATEAHDPATWAEFFLYGFRQSRAFSDDDSPRTSPQPTTSTEEQRSDNWSTEFLQPLITAANEFLDAEEKSPTDEPRSPPGSVSPTPPTNKRTRTNNWTRPLVADIPVPRSDRDFRGERAPRFVLLSLEPGFVSNIAKVVSGHFI